MTASARSQTAQSAPSDAAQTPATVIRGLIEQKTVLHVPANGKVRQSIKKDAPTFSMPDGLSPVLLFQLPEYLAPYILTVTSSPTGLGFTKRVFVPSALLIDGDFQQTRAVTEAAFTYKSQGMTKGARLEAAIPFNEPQKTERFVLLYTRTGAAGERMDKLTPVVLGAGAAGAVVGSLLTHTERSTEGSIEVEASPAKK
jgi:hypothetical protein